MTTFPNEEFPSDAVIAVLDATTDGATGLPFIAKGTSPTSTPTYEIQYNRRLHRQNAILAGVRQGMVVGEAGLFIGVYPLDYRQGGTAKHFDGATGVAVPDDTATYVWIDAGNTLQTGAAFPTDPSTHVPLARVDVASGVKSITDQRQLSLFAVEDRTTRMVPYTVVEKKAGTLAAGLTKIEFVAPVPFDIKNVVGRVRTAPAGAALIVDLKKNGASIWTNPNTDAVVIADSTQQDDSTTPATPSVVAGDVLVVDILQVGSTTAGADLTVVIDGRTSLRT